MSADTAHNVDYTSAVRTFMSCHWYHKTLEAEAEELLAKLLNVVNNRLLEKIKEKVSSESNDRQILHESQNAVEEYFGGDLKSHAVAEANRQLLLFQTGVLKYEEGSGKKKGKKPSGPTPSEVAKKNLASGIKKIFKEFQGSNSDLKMAKAAEEGLSSRTSNFLNKIVAKAATNAVDEKITPQDVKKALEEIAQGTLLKTLNSEGCRCLTLYNSGLIKFQPKEKPKEESKQKKTTSTSSKKKKGTSKKAKGKPSTKTGKTSRTKKGKAKKRKSTAKKSTKPVAKTGKRKRSETPSKEKKSTSRPPGKKLKFTEEKKVSAKAKGKSTKGKAPSKTKGKTAKGPSKGKTTKAPSKTKTDKAPSKRKGASKSKAVKGKRKSTPSKGKKTSSTPASKKQKTTATEKGKSKPSKSSEKSSKGKTAKGPSKGKTTKAPSKTKTDKAPSKGKGASKSKAVKGKRKRTPSKGKKTSSTPASKKQKTTATKKGKSKGSKSSKKKDTSSKRKKTGKDEETSAAKREKAEVKKSPKGEAPDKGEKIQGSPAEEEASKKAKTVKLQFTPGITEACQIFKVKVSLKRGAKLTINDILADICAKLATESAKKAGTYFGEKKIKVENIEAAAKDILPELLAQHAIASAGSSHTAAN